VAIFALFQKEKTLHFLKSTGFLTNQIKTYLLQD